VWSTPLPPLPKVQRPRRLAIGTLSLLSESGFQLPPHGFGHGRRMSAHLRQFRWNESDFFDRSRTLSAVCEVSVDVSTFLHGQQAGTVVAKGLPGSVVGGHC
jgi:hypothetical protein